jgi:hypothetical protein
LPMEEGHADSSISRGMRGAGDLAPAPLL